MNESAPIISSDNKSIQANRADDINLLEYLYVIIKNKWWIFGFTIIGIIAGNFTAKHKGPRYFSEVVISAKENESQKTPNLAGLGAFGGIVASQLNVNANPGLDKIDLILNSRKFNAELIEKFNLLPVIYKEAYPKEYVKFFDTLKNVWKSEFEMPQMLGMGAMLKGVYLKKTINKNNTMTIMVVSKSPEFSNLVLSKYVQYLNNYIQQNVQAEAQENVSYLDMQLVTVSDPFLREKLQGLIATELEKAMLFSKEAFRIVDPQFSFMDFKQKKQYPLFFGIGCFAAIVFIVIIYHAVVSVKKDDGDIELLKKIRRSLLSVNK